METTGRFKLPMIMPNQAQKHVTHNEALTLIDGLCHLVITSFGLTTPPPSALIDEAYGVGTPATGLWFGQEGKIAFNTDAGWRFVSPRQGVIAFNSSTSKLMIYHQNVWAPLGASIDVTKADFLGINATADTSNRLALRSNAALLTAITAADGGTGDMQLKINKEQSADTASLLYQTGFSGRAELGLTGDDDFHLKVSPDGSTWSEAWVINKSTGATTLANDSVSNAALANMAPNRFKARLAGTSGDPQDITGAQATTLLDVFTPSLKGLAPASGGGTANFLRADGAWVAPTNATLENSPARFHAFNDFLSALNSPNWTFTAFGTGAAHTQVDFPETNAIGALQSNLGTAATNRTAITSPSLNVLELGQGVAKFATRLQLASLSDATNTWALRLGFIDSVTAESTDGVFFRYTYGINSGKFEAVTRANNVETATDTGITAGTNSTYKFEIEVTAAGTSSVFKINSVPVATISTNIPFGNNRKLGYGLLALRSSGTAAITSYSVDYILADIAFTNPR